VTHPPKLDPHGAPPGRWAALPADRLAGAVLCATAAFLAWQSLRLPLGSLHDPGAGFLPLALSILMGALGSLLAAWPGKGLPLASVGWLEGRHAVAILGACAGSALLLERVGWRITCLLLLGFLLGVVERRRWWVTLLLAVGMSVGSFYLFATLLKVPLPVEPFRW
jgi:hypothetical protein